MIDLKSPVLVSERNDQSLANAFKNQNGAEPKDPTSIGIASNSGVPQHSIKSVSLSDNSSESELVIIKEKEMKEE